MAGEQHAHRTTVEHAVGEVVAQSGEWIQDWLSRTTAEAAKDSVLTVLRRVERWPTAVHLPVERKVSNGPSWWACEHVTVDQSLVWYTRPVTYSDHCTQTAVQHHRA